MPLHPWAYSSVTRQAAGLCLVVVGLDQATKLAASLAAAGRTSGLVVPVHNPRFSLGLAGAPLPIMALVMAAGILAAGGLQPVRRPPRPPAWLSGLLVGRSSSNLLDRLLLAAVRDFLATPGWSSTWPTSPSWLPSSAPPSSPHPTAYQWPDVQKRRCTDDPAPSLGNRGHAGRQLPRCLIAETAPGSTDQPTTPVRAGYQRGSGWGRRSGQALSKISSAWLSPAIRYRKGEAGWTSRPCWCTAGN
jgi:lipoprotein signal peptidase